MSETTISYRQTVDTIIAKLLDMLGITDNPKWTPKQKQIFIEEVNKMFSEITTEERETLLWYVDLYNTYKWNFLLTYVFDFLKLSVSLARKGREEIKEIGKTPLQLEEQTKRRSILERLFKFG
ncbi:MAG: hypothetical protein ACE5JB_16490 [bacterium]